MMPALCHFYGYTPQEFYDLTTHETAALARYMREYINAQRGNR